MVGGGRRDVVCKKGVGVREKGVRGEGRWMRRRCEGGGMREEG